MRWMVDAMNVIGTRPDGWWRNRHAAMVRLVDQLERFAAATGDDITVVFERPPNPAISSPVLEIASARPAPTPPTTRSCAGCGRTPDPEKIRVVTSDHALADQARFLDATVEPAEPFRRQIESA
jgi:predicted RNA-binding protein with PIN domain